MQVELSPYKYRTSITPTQNMIQHALNVATRGRHSVAAVGLHLPQMLALSVECSFDFAGLIKLHERTTEGGFYTIRARRRGGCWEGGGVWIGKK